MATAPTTGLDIKLGYGGGAKIIPVYPSGSETSVFITGGSLSLGKSPISINPYDMPFTTESRTKVFLGPGISSFSGSLNFDFTVDAVRTFISTDFLCRNNTFNVVLSDGYSTYTMYDCKYDSFSVSVSPNAIITGTLNFQFKGNWAKTGSVQYLFSDNSQLLKYWNAGNEGVESFTMTVTQALTPVYLNMYNGTDDDKQNPVYIRGGMMDMTLEISAFYDWLDHKEIWIGERKLTITTPFEESRNFSYGGLNDTGSHSYTLKSYGVETSSDNIFTIA